MSKPISFGFGKPKGSSTPAPSTSKTAISLPSKLSSKPARPASGLKASSALHGDDDDDRDDEEPKHEELAGFGSSGAILSKPVEEKKVLVIENAGNQDWRQKARGKNLLPKEVQAAKNGEDVVMVEKNEVSSASGLQLAEAGSRVVASAPVLAPQQAEKSKSADDEALQALLNDDENAPRGSAIIEAREDIKFGTQHDESGDLRDLVESYPESSTLEEYAAMPVEEFGMAMLRGMGKKRRANGEVIQLEADKDKKEVKKRKQEGYLGIGAKPAPGMEGVEIGAWGKADMRKNNKGAGFFTPVMVRDAKTGETITEEELERRKKETRSERKDDWRERRDRNLQRSQRDQNGDSDHRDRGNRISRRYHSDDSDDQSSRSRRHRSRSRSKERRRRDDDDRYDSSSSRRYRGGNRDKERDRRRDTHHDRDYDRDERRRDKRQ